MSVDQIHNGIGCGTDRISLPGFVMGPMLVYVFAVKLGWLAPSGWFEWPDIICRL